MDPRLDSDPVNDVRSGEEKAAEGNKPKLGLPVRLPVRRHGRGLERRGPSPDRLHDAPALGKRPDQGELTELAFLDADRVWERNLAPSRSTPQDTGTIRCRAIRANQ